MAKNGKTVKYTVEDYLNMLTLAKRSDKTVEGYRKVLLSYAKFLNVPLDEIHHHLSVSNLLKYAGSRKGRSDSGTKTNLSILHRYFVMNGVVFDQLEYNAVKHKVSKESNDKPLSRETIVQMMDVTDNHGKAILTTLISTGMRAGELCEIRVSDIGIVKAGAFVPDPSGDVINIRPEIAKNRHGGFVYLTKEAQEYMALWLRERDHYIAVADIRAKPLVKLGANPRPVNDERLFAVAYTSLHRWFSRLYGKVDGQKGKYHDACTIHSCRKYFRTVAAEGMHVDLVTNLMRQTGYLDNVYVKIPEDQKREAFHKGESVLYLTRKDHRIQSGELEQLRRENEELKKQVAEVMTTAGTIGIASDELQEMIQQAVADQIAAYHRTVDKGRSPLLKSIEKTLTVKK